MSQRLLICTDLDRTLIPNGPQSESPSARESFSRLTQRAEVTLADHSTWEARVVGVAPEKDLAVLKIDLDGLPAAPLAPSADLRVGDIVQ